MRVLLISGYELGHQPLHLAAAAAELLAAGFEVRALDLAVEPWSDRHLESVDAVAISVPMHTALRLGLEAARRVRRQRPGLPIAFYGLYAGVGAEESSELVDRRICGEYEDALVEWLRSLGNRWPTGGTSIDIGRRRFRRPARHLLPPLDRYAHLAIGDDHRLVGYVEASHGCRHRCTHCPVPTVYDGRYRVTGDETVLADVAQLVDAGARHITFGDPDFLNAPAYARRVLESVHSAFPDLTFDVTVKVEHILDHADLLPDWPPTGSCSWSRHSNRSTTRSCPGWTRATPPPTPPPRSRQGAGQGSRSTPPGCLSRPGRRCRRQPTSPDSSGRWIWPRSPIPSN
jgi:hypothetical protein